MPRLTPQLFAALLLLPTLIVGCFGRSIHPPGIGGNVNALVGVPPGTVGKIATTAAPSSDMKQNAKDLLEAQSQAKFWDCRIEVEKDQQKRLIAAERQHWLEMTCRALMGLCVLGMLASGFAFAASFIWPWFERLRYAAIAGVGAAVVLFVIAWYLPTQIFWIGIAIAVLTIGGVIVLFRHGHTIGKAGSEAQVAHGLAQEALAKLKALV